MEQMLFGQILLNFHLISEPELQRCLTLQQHIGSQKPLGQILLDEGLIDQKTLHTILTVQKRELDAGVDELGLSAHELSHRLAEAQPHDFLKLAVDMGASDLYVTSGKLPMVRLHGTLRDLPTSQLTHEAAQSFIFSLLTPEQQASFQHDKRVDTSITLPGIGRFRINVFRHNRGLGAVLRVLPNHVRPLDTLGLPSSVREFADLKTGLVLITGTTGSGKSTTLAALIDEMNKAQKRHIITLEDPIETVFKSDQSLITQREVGTHTASFADGLRAALREDPDVIVVGELRDPETFATALTAAETGHLVFGTLHTRSAHGTIMRVIDQFPFAQRAHVRTMLAGALRGVVCQELIPNMDGNDRSLATEVMVVNAAVSNLIREDRAWQIPMIMQTHQSKGMSLMDDCLEKLVQHKTITLEEALSRAKDQSKFVVPA